MFFSVSILMDFAAWAFMPGICRSRMALSPHIYSILHYKTELAKNLHNLSNIFANIGIFFRVFLMCFGKRDIA